MPPELILDPETIDLSRVVATREQLREYNPQRHDMEQLDAIVLVDRDQHIVIGYKDVRDDEFWVRGHMPGWPLLPGVLMCEAAAQLTVLYVQHQKITDEGALMALGGIEDARFHRPVRPGDRLVMVGTGVRVNRRMTKFKVTGYVGTERAFETTLIGVPIGKLEELTRA
jgi:3-hydroxyacyl-[acyl-carrier-protein] dehydratase